VDEAQSSASHAGSLWGFGTMRALQRAETFALIRGEVDAIFAPGSVASRLLRCSAGTSSWISMRHRIRTSA